MSNSLIIENYKGGKSFVVRGNTVLHKEQLKKMRGMWNQRLEGGAGWIFSNRHLEKINNYIKKNTNVVKKKSKLPEKKSKLPEKQSELPEKKSKLPEKQSELPEKKSKLPEKQSELPEKQSELPEKQSELPEKKSKLPEKQSKLPEKQSELPEKQSELPEKQSDLPEKQSDLPEKQSDLPEKQSDKSFLDTSIPFVIYGGKTVLYTDIDGNITTVLIIRVYNNIYAMILLPDGSRYMTTKNRLSDLHNVSLLRKRKRSLDYMNSSKKQVTDIYEKNFVERKNKYSVSMVIGMFIIFFIAFIVLSILFLYTYDLISTNCSCTFNKSVLECFKYFFNVQKIKTINY
jgi:myosin heavy subunit